MEGEADVGFVDSHPECFGAGKDFEFAVFEVVLNLYGIEFVGVARGGVVVLGSVVCSDAVCCVGVGVAEGLPDQACAVEAAFMG